MDIEIKKITATENEPESHFIEIETETKDIQGFALRVFDNVSKQVIFYASSRLNTVNTESGKVIVNFDKGALQTQNITDASQLVGKSFELKALPSKAIVASGNLIEAE